MTRKRPGFASLSDLCAFAANSSKSKHRGPPYSRQHFHPIPFCKSRALQIIPAAALPAPRNFRAPVFRFGPNRSRVSRKTSSTNARLPITPPSVKYRNRQRSIWVSRRSFKTVSLSSLASSSSEVFVTVAAVCGRRRLRACPGFFPRAIPIIRRYKRETSGHRSASKPTPSLENQARTNPSRDFLPLPFFPPPIASP
jgi:hypothetical protein